MTFKLSKRSYTRLEGVHPDMVNFVECLITITPVDFGVIEGLRTIERQKELVASGASQTMDSRHITGHAVDLGAYVGKDLRWDMNLYYQIADAAREACKRTKTPIRWGGAWARLDTGSKPASVLVAEYAAAKKAQGKKAFIDAPHFELPKTVYG